MRSIIHFCRERIFFFFFSFSKLNTDIYVPTVKSSFAEKRYWTRDTASVKHIIRYERRPSYSCSTNNGWALRGLLPAIKCLPAACKTLIQPMAMYSDVPLTHGDTSVRSSSFSRIKNNGEHSATDICLRFPSNVKQS